MLAKKPKGPMNMPERGDRCAMRGDSTKTGVLQKYDPDSNWSTVLWDDGVRGPAVVHRFELARDPHAHRATGPFPTSFLAVA